jgi:hypothetical protein
MPSERVFLSWLGFGDTRYPRGCRGVRDVGNDFIHFQDLWEERKAVPSFSGLSINRHIHGLLLLSPTFILQKADG